MLTPTRWFQVIGRMVMFCILEPMPISRKTFGLYNFQRSIVCARVRAASEEKQQCTHRVDQNGPYPSAVLHVQTHSEDHFQRVRFIELAIVKWQSRLGGTRIGCDIVDEVGNWLGRIAERMILTRFGSTKNNLLFYAFRDKSPSWHEVLEDFETKMDVLLRKRGE